MKKITGVILFTLSIAIYSLLSFVIPNEKDQIFNMIFCVTVAEFVYLYFIMIPTIAYIKGKKITEIPLISFCTVVSLTIILIGLFFSTVRDINWVIIVATYVVLTLGYLLWYMLILLVRHADNEISELNKAALSGKKEIVNRIRAIEMLVSDYEVKKRLRTAEEFAKNINSAVDETQINQENDILSFLDELEELIASEKADAVSGKINDLIVLIQQRRNM